jgi:transcriptional regulator with XRE-family HTH domain
VANAGGREPDQPGGAGRIHARRRREVREGANPTLRQRELGIRLRELRMAAGLGVEDVAQRMLCSATKVSRLETGSRRASLRDVRDLCAIYGVTEQEPELADLARQAREPGWWSQYDEPVLSPYIGLEQEAVAISAYSMYFVPALLQTSNYARVTMRSIERKMDPAVLDQRVEARLRRQELLERRMPPRYRVLLDEAVLHRQVGGAAVMQAQLDKILKAAAEEKVTVQVIPFDVGAHASTDSNFVLLEFEDGSLQGPVVFVEGLFSNRYQERKAEIDRYREALEYLRDAALSPRDSISLIAEIGSRTGSS